MSRLFVVKMPGPTVAAGAGRASQLGVGAFVIIAEEPVAAQPGPGKHGQTQRG